MFIKSHFNYDMDGESEKTGLKCEDPSRAQQNFKEETDINTIVRRFNITGQLPDNVRAPTYVDYEGVFDFQSAMNTMLETEQSFMAMPADVRKRFSNNPQEFLDFCDRAVRDPALADEAVRMGLAVKRPEPVAPKEPETSSST